MIDAPARRPETVLHLLMWDHGSASSHYLQKAECGRYVRPNEMAPHRDQVTCLACKAAIDTYEAMAIAEDE